jgi:hypothetical protein
MRLVLFAGQQLVKKALLGTSLVMMTASPGVSLREIRIATGALNREARNGS